MNPEITTAAERAATTATTATAEPETKLTLSQLHSLLRDAAALERAHRPIVPHAAAVTVPAAITLPTVAGYAPPCHQGLDITIPSVPEAGAGWAELLHCAPSRPGWGVRLACCSMVATLAGAAAAGATDGDLAAVGLAAAGVLGAIGGIAQAVAEQNRKA